MEKLIKCKHFNISMFGYMVSVYYSINVKLVLYTFLSYYINSKNSLKLFVNLR